MWTTYSPYVYACESLSVDEDREDREDREINIEEVLPDGWVVLEGEDEEVPF